MCRVNDAPSLKQAEVGCAVSNATDVAKGSASALLLQQGISYRLFDAGQLQLQEINNPKINSIPLVLYLNTFTDAGYVSTPSVVAGNRLPTRLLASVGVGLHLVTYYDRVFTLEYTRNLRGQGGFFLRSEFPI